MISAPPSYAHSTRVPFHFWLVGLLLLLWNWWGLFGAIASQVRLLPEMPAEAVAYLDRQPLWFMIVGDISPLAGAAGALALLVQSRWAVPLFLTQLGVLILANAYDVLLGTSPLITVAETRWSTGFLVAILAAQTFYAYRMARRGLLS